LRRNLRAHWHGETRTSAQAEVLNIGSFERVSWTEASGRSGDLLSGNLRSLGWSGFEFGYYSLASTQKPPPGERGWAWSDSGVMESQMRKPAAIADLYPAVRGPWLEESRWADSSRPSWTKGAQATQGSARGNRVATTRYGGYKGACGKPQFCWQ